MSLLRIYFSAQWRDASSPCPWTLGEASGEVLQSGETPITSLPKADEYLAIIAADRVTCISVSTPAKSRRRTDKVRRRWEAALPLVAEEFSLSEPEQLHVVPGATLANGTCPLVLIDKAWLHAIVAACRAAHRPLRRVLPETFLPPLAPHTWVLVWDGHGGFLRTGESSGCVMDNGDAQHAPLALKLSLHSAQPEKIEIRFPVKTADQELPNWSELPVTLLGGEVWDWRSVPIQKQVLNLLWGEFAPRIKLREWLPKLRAPLLMLCAVLMLEAIASNLEWLRLASEKRSLTQQIERSFRSAFGESSALVDPVLQMQRNLAALYHAAGLPDETDFLSLLDGSASVFAALPAGSVRALHYESGRLDVDVHLGNAGDLGLLQQSLQRRGFIARNGEVHKGANGIDTRISLQREVAR